MTTKPPETLTLDRVPTPIGDALIVVDGQARLCAFDWEDYEDRLARLVRRFLGPVELKPGPAPAAIRRPIEAYFRGDLDGLGTIACRIAGTAFQHSVWTALRDIRAGTTESYGGLAVRLGRPNAVRAVGLANGANPISVVVPCHRVIGSDGSLTGYGGGLPRKRWLLEHGRAILT